MQANDSISTGRVMKAIVQLCFDTQEWDTLNEHILILTKRRNQLKTVSAGTVRLIFYSILATHLYLFNCEAEFVVYIYVFSAMAIMAIWRYCLNLLTCVLLYLFKSQQMLPSNHLQARDQCVFTLYRLWRRWWRSAASLWTRRPT